MTLQVVDYFLSRLGVYYRNRWLYFSPLFSLGALGRCYWRMCGRFADVRPLGRPYLLLGLVQVLFYPAISAQFLGTTRTWTC